MDTPGNPEREGPTDPTVQAQCYVVFLPDQGVSGDLGLAEVVLHAVAAFDPHAEPALDVEGLHRGVHGRELLEDRPTRYELEQAHAHRLAPAEDDAEVGGDPDLVRPAEPRRQEQRPAERTPRLSKRRRLPAQRNPRAPLR